MRSFTPCRCCWFNQLRDGRHDGCQRVLVTCGESDHECPLDQRECGVGELLCGPVSSDVSVFLAVSQQLDEAGRPCLELATELLAKQLGGGCYLGGELSGQASSLIAGLDEDLRHFGEVSGELLRCGQTFLGGPFVKQ